MLPPSGRPVFTLGGSWIPQAWGGDAGASLECLLCRDGSCPILQSVRSFELNHILAGRLFSILTFRRAPNPCRQEDIKSTPAFSQSFCPPELRLCRISAVQGPSLQSVLSSRSSVQVCEKVLITERAAGTARHRHLVLHKAPRLLRGLKAVAELLPLPHQPINAMY